MGSYLYNTVLILFLLTIYILFFETQLYQEHTMVGKAYVEEAAAAGAQYFEVEEYGDGFYNFNQEQSIKAIEYSLKNNFELNEDFTTKEKGYWKDKLEYEVTFVDYDSPQYNGFPNIYKFSHFGTEYQTILEGPSVIVTIYLGEQPYKSRFLKPFKKDNYLTGIHTFEE